MTLFCYIPSPLTVDILENVRTKYPECIGILSYGPRHRRLYALKDILPSLVGAAWTFDRIGRRIRVATWSNFHYPEQFHRFVASFFDNATILNLAGAVVFKSDYLVHVPVVVISTLDKMHLMWRQEPTLFRLTIDSDGRQTCPRICIRLQDSGMTSVIRFGLKPTGIRGWTQSRFADQRILFLDNPTKADLAQLSRALLLEGFVVGK